MLDRTQHLHDEFLQISLRQTVIIAPAPHTDSASYSSTDSSPGPEAVPTDVAHTAPATCAGIVAYLKEATSNPQCAASVKMRLQRTIKMIQDAKSWHLPASTEHVTLYGKGATMPDAIHYADAHRDVHLLMPTDVPPADKLHGIGYNNRSGIIPRPAAYHLQELTALCHLGHSVSVTAHALVQSNDSCETATHMLQNDTARGRLEGNLWASYRAADERYGAVADAADIDGGTAVSDYEQREHVKPNRSEFAVHAGNQNGSSSRSSSSDYNHSDHERAAASCVDIEPMSAAEITQSLGEFLQIALESAQRTHALQTNATCGKSLVQRGGAANAPASATEVQEPDVCGICLDPFTTNSDISKTPCGHTFHFLCMVQMYRKNVTVYCPMCRALLENVVAVSEGSEEENIGEED